MGPKKTSPYGSCSWHWVNPTWFNHLRTVRCIAMALPPARGVSYLRSRKSSPTWSNLTPADLMDKPFGDGSFDGIQPDKKSLGFWCLATQIYPNIRSYLPGISIVLMIFYLPFGSFLRHIVIFDLWFSSFPAWNHLNGNSSPRRPWHRCTLTMKDHRGLYPLVNVYIAGKIHQIVAG
jgi:hypothetical protein